eukprot:4870662-Amphidinium_carterae.1
MLVLEWHAAAAKLCACCASAAPSGEPPKWQTAGQGLDPTTARISCARELGRAAHFLCPCFS